MKKKRSKQVPAPVQLRARDVTIFKIANRRGYAAIAKNNLTEGRSIPQAYSRLAKALRRIGCALPETPPAPAKG